MSTQKAKRATIKLGAIELDCYQMPNGEYRYTKSDAEASLGYEPTRRAYRDFLKSKDAKALQAQELSAGNIKYKDIGNTYTLITQLEMILFWRFSAQNGSDRALDILGACAEEALERRADAAFNVTRSEEERDQRLALRTAGIFARRTLTDAIRDYLDRHPELSDTYRKFIWSSCSDHLNKIVLGAKAKQAREYYEIPKNSLLRNHIPIAALNELERTEDLAGRHVDERDLEPLEAVKMAAAVMFTKTVGLE